MAFYQDAPHQKRKVNPANQGSWDDEGSHYNKSSRPVHRFGPEAGQPVRGGRASDRNDYRDGRAFQGEGRGTRRNNRDSRYGNSNDRRDNRNGDRFDRPARNDRYDRSAAPRTERPAPVNRRPARPRRGQARSRLSSV